MTMISTAGQRCAVSRMMSFERSANLAAGADRRRDLQSRLRLGDAAHERCPREVIVLDDENGLELSAQETPPAIAAACTASIGKLPRARYPRIGVV
jgi:hypothetical protein